mmetsp:Transcript_97061/g.182556  ORF Transcript_97061/g.182556 Transcript_97061/m.182556 type:complete len:404 (-) Transcript_97061:13-1224(-)
MSPLLPAKRHCTRAANPSASEFSACGVSAMDFKVMTYNVEEYWHGFDPGPYRGLHRDKMSELLKQGTLQGAHICEYFARLKANVFRNISVIRSMIEQSSPDVVCLEEHSSGLERSTPYLEKCGFKEVLTDEVLFSHDDIVKALLPDGYGIFMTGTGESPCKFSELANAVAWKKDKFELVDEQSQVGVVTTEKHKATPCGESHYTPRSAACVCLKPLGVNASNIVICATHLMGGRFEDRNWAVDCEFGVNERVNQVVAIQDAIRENFEKNGEVPSVIAGDFNVMKKGFTEGPFVKDTMKYVIGDTMLYPQHQLEKDYREKYVPYQAAVHDTLEALGYTVAYGREDDVAEMKTSKTAGCVDWIYTKGLTSKKDEQVLISCVPGTNMWVSDHNAVVVTLTLSAIQE